MKYTPDNIETLEPNQIFVFGSNLAGRHGAGAAKLAREKFGAIYGQGEGLQGQSYALPTLDHRLGILTPNQLLLSFSNLYISSSAEPRLEFLLTKVGCGLAGYPEEIMIEIFRSAAKQWPLNVIAPKGWIEE